MSSPRCAVSSDRDAKFDCSSRKSLTDRKLLCAACGHEFAITPSESLFYAERGIQEPTCCPSCRAQRRADRHSALIAVSGQPMRCPGWEHTADLLRQHPAEARERGESRLAVRHAAVRLLCHSSRDRAALSIAGAATEPARAVKPPSIWTHKMGRRLFSGLLCAARRFLFGNLAGEFILDLG